MELIHLTANELATRWRTSISTLASWRFRGEGPAYIKLGRKVLYRVDVVEAWERSHGMLATSVKAQP